MSNSRFVSVHRSLVLNVTNQCGGQDFYVSEEEFDRIKHDLDGWAAQQFGLCLEDYAQWIECSGVALCGAKTRKGTLCQNILTAGYQCGAQEWKERHRSEYCAIHGGEGRS